MRIALKVKKIGKKWWIVGDEDYGAYGPYDTKHEAESDRRGVLRCLREMEEDERKEKHTH